ncbi:flavodoxin family protein [bacterium]|nr:flavodoxin family protein [bacterium]
MKVLMINGSPHPNGNTAIALEEMKKVFEAAPLFADCDEIVVGTPFDKTMKVGASVVVARRGGLSATFDEINKYFTICGMPVASSQYWNSVHGREPGEANQDAESLQTMRTLARNMTFLMKSIALGKEKFGLPEKEEWVATHFIR